MAVRSRSGLTILAFGAALALSLLGVIGSGASVMAGGKIVSAKLTPKTSFTAAQATTIKLVCKFSPASKRATSLLSMKKSGKWVKVRSATKKGDIKTTTTTVKKLFGPKAVKVGQYQVKVSADANSLTRKFAVTAPAATAGTESGSGGSGDEGDESGEEGSGSGSGSRDPGDCGEDCEGDPGDEDPGGGGGTAPGAFSKISPGNGTTSSSPIALSWSVSSNAEYYEYCVDLTDDTATKACHIPGYGGTGWVKVSSTSATVSGLTAGKTYYWQVHAYGGGYGMYADGGTWFSFAVAP